MTNVDNTLRAVNTCNAQLDKILKLPWYRYWTPKWQIREAYYLSAALRLLRIVKRELE